MRGISVSWLYLSEAEIERAEKLIAAFKEDDAADSLGLRPLNDLFSEWLYPGLTTPMTHARYFVFIPTILQDLEQRNHLNPGRVRDAAKKAQHELRKRLGRVEGNIGRRSGERLKKWPTTIYWNGLRNLKIMQQPMSEGAYYAAVCSRVRADWRSDDGTSHVEEAAGFWDDGYPPAKEIRGIAAGVSRRITFDLSRLEALYLRRKFIQLSPNSGSLFTYRLSRRDARQNDYPWQVHAPGELGRKLHHAHALSAASRGLTLIYYHLLHAACARRQAADDVIAEFCDWRRELGALVREWDIAELKQLLESTDHRTAAADVEFLIAFQKGLRSHRHGREIPPDLRTLVRKREMQKKRTKCRLCGQRAHRRYLRQWNRPDDEDRKYSFLYRHKVGQQVLGEILEALS